MFGEIVARLIAAALVVILVIVFIPALFGWPVIGGAIIGALWGISDND